MSKVYIGPEKSERVNKVYIGNRLPSSPHDRRVFQDTPMGTKNLGLVGTRLGVVLWMDGYDPAVELSGDDIRDWEKQIQIIVGK